MSLSCSGKNHEKKQRLSQNFIHNQRRGIIVRCLFTFLYEFSQFLCLQFDAFEALLGFRGFQIEQLVLKLGYHF